jgi:hypothetical protein
VDISTGRPGKTQRPGWLAKTKTPLESQPGHEPGHIFEDSFIGLLHKIIRSAVKVLAVLTVAVIVWGIGDIVDYSAGHCRNQHF